MMYFMFSDHFKSERTAVEQLKSRFEAMNLSYDAYRYEIC